jgi:hypothetical protein
MLFCVSTRSDVTLVTYQDFPNLSTDDRIFREALIRRGTSVRTAVWDDPSIDWSESRVTVLRSLWDYHLRPDVFALWIDDVETQTMLINSPSLVRWNMHKRYLHDLHGSGIRIVPTLFARSDETIDLQAECALRGWNDVIIKPCVAGSAFGARRFHEAQLSEEGQEYLRNAAGAQGAMIQPYFREVESARERTLVFFNASFSHAALKAPFSGIASAEKDTAKPYAPTKAEVAFAQSVLATLPVVPAYARIDFVVRDEQPFLMELELIEPFLYFGYDSAAAARFADIVLSVPAAIKSF